MFNQETKKKVNRINYLFAVLFFAVEIGMGLINAPSSRTAWVLIPYLFLLLPTGYFAGGAITFASTDGAMESKAFQKSVKRMHHAALAILVLTGCDWVLDVVFMVLHRANDIAWGSEILFNLGFAFLFIILFCYSKIYNRYFASLSAE